MITKILEKYFQGKKQELLEIVESFNKTEYGREQPLDEKEIKTYSQFCKIPFLTGKILQETPKKLIINGGKLLSFKSGGTTAGILKTIFCPEEVSCEYVPDAVVNATKKKIPIVALHTKRKGREYAYWVYEKIYRKFCPSLQVLEYFNQSTAINALKHGKVIVVFEYPSAFYRLLFYIGDYLKKNPTRKNLFQKENVIIELMGEPIDIKELKMIERRSKEIFGCQPIIWVSYGLTECGSVGIYIYNDKGQEVLYCVNDSRVFVEVINPNSGKPMGLGKKGEIVVSSFRKRGTILVRYKTEDLGKLYFFNNQPILKIYGRKPGVITVYFCGSQFSVKALRDEIIKHFNIYLKIKIIRKISSKVGKETLFINLYLFLEPTQSIKNKITNYIENWIVKETQLGEEEIKSIKLIIKFFSQSVNEPLKSWTIKKSVN